MGAHGIVHRLDWQTSGVLLCATSYQGYYAAKLQFAARRVRKRYVCLCHGHMPSELRWLQGSLLAVLQRNAWRSIVVADGARACTEVCGVGHLQCSQGLLFSLVEV